MATDEQTRFGFKWGQIEVARLASFVRREGKGATRILRVKTEAGKEIEIYVSPTGRSLRVFRDGKELK